MTGEDAEARARDLVERANADPADVAAEVSGLLTTSALSPTARALALRAQGIAYRAMGSLSTSLEALGRAVEVAEAAGLDDVAASCRSTLAASRAYAGDFQGALDELDRAEPHLDARERARAAFQRGGVLQRMGRTAAALDVYDGALQALEAVGDDLFAAHLLANRGLLHGYAGAMDHAVADVEEARRRYGALEQPALAATMVNNLGFLATRSGDLLTALEHFDKASRAFERLGMRDWVTAMDRCEALVAAGLVDEAAERASEAAAGLAAEGMQTDQAEALLLQAEAALAAGRLESARTAATAAAELFDAQGRDGWTARALRVTLDAEVRAEGPTAGRAAAAERLARRLDRAGQSLTSRSAWLLAARTRAGAGGDADAARILERLPAVDHVTTALALEERLTRAVVALGTGRRSDAVDAAEAGMRLLDRRRGALGSLDLRSHVALHGRDLAALGLRIAVEDADPEQVLRWMEWTRARALQFPPTAPPDDPELAAALVRERTVAADLEAAEREGRPVAGLLAELDRARDAVNRRARRQAGSASVPPVVALADVAGRLGGRRLLEFAVVDDRVVGVELQDGAARLWTAGAVDDVRGQVDRLRLVLDRLALSPDDAGPATLERVLARLDDLLFGGWVRRGGTRSPVPTVVVPSAALVGAPWSSLPTLRESPVTVLPSAALLRPAAPATDAPVVLVAGPGLDWAGLEVDAVADVRPGAAVRDGPSATVGRVLALLEGAGVAHLTCHGVFDARQPLFSSLQLADGHLTLHDVARLRRVPDLVVLSACHAATSAALPGDELLGLPGAFLGAGASTVVAASGLVPDAAPTVAVMRRFHERLVAGASPGRALRSASDAADDVPATVRFTVFGGE